MNCIIVASGNLVFSQKIKRLLNEADLIIAADGGATHLRGMNLFPDRSEERRVGKEC